MHFLYQFRTSLRGSVGHCPSLWRYVKEGKTPGFLLGCPLDQASTSWYLLTKCSEYLGTVAQQKENRVLCTMPAASKYLTLRNIGNLH